MEIGEPEKFLAEVIAREEVHTTFMGNGVALPHARTDLVTTLSLGIGRSVEGVPFGEKGELAHLIFVIGVPKKMINNYLVCVGALARLTKVEETRRRCCRRNRPRSSSRRYAWVRCCWSETRLLKVRVQ
jgi:mannitol/fructose-specific phosphotransferase system IIA component (Ntr-type)